MINVFWYKDTNNIRDFTELIISVYWLIFGAVIKYYDYC